MKPKSINVNELIMDKLHFCLWNIQGIKDSKNIAGEVNIYDVIILTETHTEENNGFNLPGFKSYSIFRPKTGTANGNYGGVTVLVKSNIANGIECLPCDSFDYIWIKLKQTFFHTANDIYLCAAYIPPVESPYLARLPKPLMEEIEKDIKYYGDKGDIILCGDLNARTGNALDFINNDSSKYLPTENYELDHDINQRHSLDKEYKGRGPALIELCMSAQLRILNGRTFGDSLGKFTCHKWNGSSVVDYIITSHSIVNTIPFMHVHKWNPLLSDHCKLTFQMNLKQPIKITDETNHGITMPSRYPKSSKFYDKFKLIMNSQHIKDTIDHMTNNSKTHNHLPVDHISEELTNILITAAQKAVNMHGKHKSRKHRLGPKWDNPDLKYMRFQVKNLGHKLEKQPKNAQVRQSFFYKLKQYRKLNKKTKRKYSHQLLSEMKNLENDNPKMYWELLEKLKSISGPNKDQIDKISLKEWTEHFTKLNTQTISNEQEKVMQTKLEKLEKHEIFNELSFKIKEDEILKVVRKLKKGKAPGLDNISSEMVQASINIILPVLHILFNKVLLESYSPQAWTTGYITTVYKKNNPLLPGNYRGITITSCISKIFNTILNNRLTSFLKTHGLLNMYQNGFVKKARTSDHIFTLKTLIDKYKKNKKKLYACFIDLEKAFDTVWHTALMVKLLQCNVGGLFYKIIKDMYSRTFLQVRSNSLLSGKFKSYTGIRQGDVLSPQLWNIFTNDLPNILTEEAFAPPTLINSKVPCLLYADDIILLSENEQGLQNSLTRVDQYCQQWGLKINVKKTQFLIFNSNNRKKIPVIKLGQGSIEHTTSYTYLGIELAENGEFSKAREILHNKGLKAFHKMCKIFGYTFPDTQTVLHVFDHTVQPILLYGSEIWGMTKINRTKIKKDQTEFKIFTAYEGQTQEKVNIKLCKYLLNVNKRASNDAVRGELGRYPLYIKAIEQMIKYWIRLNNNTTINPLLYEAFCCNKIMAEENQHCWASNIKFILKETNLEHFWTAPKVPCFIAHKIRKLLKIKYKRSWENKLAKDDRQNPNDSNKLRTYRQFKIQFEYEKYLSIRHAETRSHLTKFRISSHKLEIEQARYYKPKPPANERYCKICMDSSIEDEKHFLLNCKLYEKERKQLLQIVQKVNPNFDSQNENNKFTWLLSSPEPIIYRNLAQFIGKMMDKRNDYLQRQ